LSATRGANALSSADWQALPPEKEEQEVMVVPSWLGDTFLLQMLYQTNFLSG
jgi:hypothetical protein